MGQFEKIVVLTVLSLIAVILVISFSTSEDPLAGIDGGEVAAAGLDAEGPGPAPKVIPGKRSGPAAPAPEELDLRDPFDAGAAGEETEGTALDWPEEQPEATEPAPADSAPADEELDGGRLMLTSNVRTEEPAPAARDPRLPEDAALVTLDGLEDTFDPELKLYTWRRGDSFEALARRFYGDAREAGLLRLHNEGREQIPAGETILVPVFDHGDAAPQRVAAARTHVVEDGESLWSIATKEYGKGTEWQRIFEANQDRLESADDVRVGMELRLP
jgi:nucleoid-associated protein YgaU